MPAAALNLAALNGSPAQGTSIASIESTDAARAARARVDQWLAELIPDLNLKLDAEGVCSVGHDSGLDCGIEVPESAAQICLRIPVAPLATLGSAQLRQCLASHLFGVGTHGALYGIDEATDELVLWRTLDLAGLDATGFAAALLHLFDTARDSASWLRSGASLPALPATTTATTAATAATPGMLETRV